MRKSVARQRSAQSGMCVPLGLCLLLGGCVTDPTPVSPLFPFPYQGQLIIPVTDLKVGQVYRTDAKNVSNDQISYVVNICPMDYVQTPALAAIARKYSDPSLFVDTGGGATITRNLNASGRAGGINVKFLQLDADASVANSLTYDYEGVKRIDVQPEDAATIKAKLGQSCNNLIAAYRKQGYSVFVVAGAWWAGTIATTVDLMPSANLDAGIQLTTSFSPSAKVSYSDEQKIVTTGKNQYFVAIPLN